MVDSVSTSPSRSPSLDQFGNALKSDYEGYGKALASMVNRGDSSSTPGEVAAKSFGVDGATRKQAGAWDAAFHSGDSQAAASFVNNLSPDKLRQVAMDPNAMQALNESLNKHTAGGPAARPGIYREDNTGAPSDEARMASAKLDGARASEMKRTALDARQADVGVGQGSKMGSAHVRPGAPALPVAAMTRLSGNEAVDGVKLSESLASGKATRSGKSVFAGGVRLEPQANGSVVGEDIYGKKTSFDKSSSIAAMVTAMINAQ
jgi:hypothetical protein